VDAPGFALAPPVVRLFNRLYYRRIPASGRTVVKPLGDFFFPLDRIHDWNRLYGKAGFHQFQCVVPPEAAGVLREMLEKVSDAGLASPLAVLKRLGPGRAGHLSFPMDGYTLAVDLRARDGAEALIGRLNDMAADAGGRVYFAKDSLLAPGRVPDMYPEAAEWAAEVARVDPERRLLTDLVRRLNLRPAS
jgi:decaprenylphospho-beta-D-ribofuranose 2-oxidase